MIRMMCIDYGDSRVGVAVNDLLGYTAQGVKTVQNRGVKKTLADLSILIDEYKPVKIIIGLPKNMDGSSGFRVEETNKFADALKEIYDGEIILWDERLSTAEAYNILDITNTFGKRRKNVIDTVSAAVILENYMKANMIQGGN